MNAELFEYIQSFGVMGVLILLVVGGGKYIVNNLSSQITDVHGIVIKLIDRLNQSDARADVRNDKFMENYGETINRFASKVERLERIVIELKGKLDIFPEHLKLFLRYIKENNMNTQNYVFFSH